MTETPAWFTASDGVRLDTSTCVPEGDPPVDGWPAVVLVHGHGEDGSKASTLEQGRRYATDHGYLALCYSVRGQGGSEGLSFHLGARELFDLQEIVASVQADSRVDRARVAVVGSSQGGWHSWMAAAHCPGLATAVPQNIFVDYADFAVPHGALSTWFFLRTMRRRVMTAGLQDLARQWAVAGDWHRLRTWLAPMSPVHHAARIRCPVLVVHGWHDVGMPANDLLTMFERLDAPKKLVLGGGGHDGQDATDAARRRQELVDRWLAHWLKDRDSGLLDEPPVTIAVRPGWEHVAVDAVDGDARQTLYLRHGGTLSAEAPPQPTPNSNINHVSRDPHYTLEVALHHDLDGTEAAWPREEARFDGPALDAPLELRGSPVFTVHTLPNRPFLQVHAELHDVAPDGEVTLITRGHHGQRDATPGAHLRLDITCRAIAYRVAAGHRLRVVIADQRPAYVVPIYRPWRARLFHEPQRASCVELPVIAAGHPTGA